MLGYRDIIISEYFKNILQECINEYKNNKQNLLFCRKNGELITGSMVNSAFKRFCEKHNINDKFDVRFHQLRHTFGTRLIEMDTPIKVVQKKLGHVDIGTTLNIYTDVLPEFEKEVDKKFSEKMKEKGLII